jgi:hypothetical protein
MLAHPPALSLMEQCQGPCRQGPNGLSSPLAAPAWLLQLYCTVLCSVLHLCLPGMGGHAWRC